MLPLLLLLLPAIKADMYDVLEPTKLPAASCEDGCKAWVDVDPAVWIAGAPPPGAANHCAQPGAAVNTKRLGAWCFCANTTGSQPPAPAPTAPISSDYFGVINEGSYVTNGPLWVNISEATGIATFTWYFDHSGGVKPTYCYKATEVLNWTESSTGAVQARGKSFYIFNGTRQPHSQGTYSGQIWNIDGILCGSWSVTKGVEGKRPWCLDGVQGTCTSALSVPEQVNVQAGSGGSVVISFVTFESSPQTRCSPVVLLGTSNASLTRVVPGVTHIYTTHSEPHRTYHLHFVALSGLVERQRYFYRVRAGHDPDPESSPVSKVFSFRAGYTSGHTVVDIYGDMGVPSAANQTVTAEISI